MSATEAKMIAVWNSMQDLGAAMAPVLATTAAPDWLKALRVALDAAQDGYDEMRNEEEGCGMRPDKPPAPTPEERHLDTLKAIARGKPMTGQSFAGVNSQALARRVLVATKQDWKVRGDREVDDAAVTSPLQVQEPG